MITKEKTSVAKILNDLIILNNDRIEGYEKATKETEDPELKNLFNSMSYESRKLRIELISVLVELNEIPSEGTSISGKIHNIWMDIKNALIEKNKNVILTSCELGENIAQETYNDALGIADLSIKYKTMLTKQKLNLQNSIEKIRAIKNSIQ